MAQHPRNSSEQLSREILNFCRHVAGPCEITAACTSGDYISGLTDARKQVKVLLVIRDFQPRLMNYVNIFDDRNIVVSATDMWVFERDVDRGFLGEALASTLTFPYMPLLNENYLHKQEVKLKKRLITELLESLVLNFPELSYEIRIKPEYFMYETLLSRARLFPPMIQDMLSFMQRSARKENLESVLKGYLEALEELKKENVISFSEGYIKISRKFADSVRSKKVRFVSLLKTAQKAQRTLFTSLLNIFPNVMSFISQNKETLLKLPKIADVNSKTAHQIEDPQRYLYVPTASGLVPLANRIDIEAFARKMLSAKKDTTVKIEEIGGVLNDVYLIRALTDRQEKKIVVKSYRDLSNFKWFPLTLWTVGTRTFAVSGLSRLERECAINQFLHSNGFAVPEILHVSPSERLIFMEHIEGESLEKIIRKIVNSKTKSGTEKELSVISRVAEKFAKAHALNVSLGDTKPENIMIGKDGEIYLLDFEQASRNGDKTWDIAEFLYYAGHYIPPWVGTHPAENLTRTFIEGYLRAGGDAKVVKKVGNPKYTKVFSIFTFPHIILAISNICKNVDKKKEI
ncbi:MAG: hypothetical protein QXN36_01500 [Candidatus Bathyarchaeia archaeon]